jgi:hypothetical protein
MQSAIDIYNKEKIVSAFIKVKDIEIFKAQYPECKIDSETKIENGWDFRLTCSREMGLELAWDDFDENIINVLNLLRVIILTEPKCEDPLKNEIFQSIAEQDLYNTPVITQSKQLSKWRSMLNAIGCCFPCFDAESNNQNDAHSNQPKASK